jgi:hypothetical protein
MDVDYQEWRSCPVCYITAEPFDAPAICGRRTEEFTRCHACHELISWGLIEWEPHVDPDEVAEKLLPPTPSTQDEDWPAIGKSRGACRCGSASWEHREGWLGHEYDYTPGKEEPRRSRDRVESAMTTRQALGLVMRDWGRRAGLGLLWTVGGGAVALLAVLFFAGVWDNEINAFFGQRPSRGELLVWFLCFIWLGSMARDARRWLRRRLGLARYRREERIGALKQARAVLRRLRPRRGDTVVPPG